MRRWLIGFVTVAFALAGQSSTYADTPLDVVGIKIGMPLNEAINALKAHNPRMKLFPYTTNIPPSLSNLDQAQTRAFGRIMQIEFKGLPSFVWQVSTQSEDFKATADVKQELIDLYVAPGPPDVVVGIRRYVGYQTGHERAITTIVAGLKEKYGSSPGTAPGPSGKPRLLVWYYDATGRPIVRSGTGSPEFPGPCNNIQAYGRGFGGMNLSLPARVLLDTAAKECGAFAFAEITEFPGGIIDGRRLPANWDLAQAISITVGDMVLRARRYNAANDVVENFANRQQQQQTGEASKRREKF